MTRDEVKALLKDHEGDAWLWSSLAAIPFGLLCSFGGALAALASQGLL